MDPTIEDSLLTFSIPQLEKLGDQHSEAYKSASPWPHTVIDNFLPEHVARNILDVFPGPDHEVWLDWTKRDVVNQPKKQGIGRAARLEGISPYLWHVLQTFQSYPFVNFLEHLTGIEKLIPDPNFFGGGLHQILSGGHLSVHADSNRHPQLNLYRRINTLLYLNLDWQPDYHGDFELWDTEGTACVKSIAPLFNQLVVFSTTKQSFHGHPKPLTTPSDVTRKSLAFFYYTTDRVDEERYDNRTYWIETETS